MNRHIRYCSLLTIALLSFSCKQEINNATPEQLKVTTVVPQGGGANARLDDWVYIDFNTPLDTNNSAEVFAKVRVTPSVDHLYHFLYGTLEGLRIEPAHDWSPNTTYHVEIDSSLKAKNGTMLAKTFSTSFQTGSFYIFYGSPRDQDTAVYRRSYISVSFSGRISASYASAPIGFSISPSAAGRFQNYPTIIYFIPDSLNANTNYTVSVYTTLESIGGLRLQEPYVYSFRTGRF